MGAKRVSKQGVTVSEGNAIEVTNTAGTALFSVNSTGNINTLANLTAKGSILTASAANTPTTLAVGTNEHRLVADSATTSGLKYVADTTNYAINAKGDLLVGTAADTVTNLAVASTAGWVLTVDSATTSGLKWAAVAAGGKVLQVVEGTYATLATNTTSTLADTGLTASITPAATSSKVLVLFSIHGGANHLNNLNETEYALIRGATNIYQARGLYTETGLKKYMTTTGVYLDSPSTTSSTTYKVQFRNINNSDGVYANISTTSTIILMEIGA